MKKIFKIIVSFTIVLSLTACGGQVATVDKDEDNLQPPSISEETNPTNPVDEKQESENKSESETPIYSIKIDGEEYTFPMSYETFKSYGWTYYIPENDDVTQWPTVIEPGRSIDGLYYDNGDIKALEFYAFNPTEKDITVDKAEIIGFRVEYDQIIAGEDAENYMNIPAGSIVLNGKADIGKAGKKDVYDYVGEDSVHKDNPDINYENSEVFLYYLDESERVDKCMTITFNQNGIFNEMTYLNIGD